MEAKELMIGDWLCYEGEHNIQVKGIDFPPNGNSAYISFGAEFYHCDDFSPIPLTTEILEKNGFKIEEEYDKIYDTHNYYATLNCVDSKKRNVEVNYSTFSNEITIFCHDRQNILLYCNLETQIKHVHELQHALRLCGIEKEIEL